MFRGYTGCILAGAGLLAGAIYCNLIIMVSSFITGAAIAALSCLRAEKKQSKFIDYPSYKY